MVKKEKEVIERRRKEDSWHLKKEFNIGHLLTTIVLAGGIIIWGMKMDSRVAVLEAGRLDLRGHIQEINTNIRDIRNFIMNDND